MNTVKKSSVLATLQHGFQGFCITAIVVGVGIILKGLVRSPNEEMSTYLYDLAENWQVSTTSLLGMSSSMFLFVVLCEARWTKITKTFNAFIDLSYLFTLVFMLVFVLQAIIIGMAFMRTPYLWFYLSTGDYFVVGVICALLCGLSGRGLGLIYVVLTSGVVILVTGQIEALFLCSFLAGSAILGYGINRFAYLVFAKKWGTKTAV